MGWDCRNASRTGRCNDRRAILTEEMARIESCGLWGTLRTDSSHRGRTRRLGTAVDEQAGQMIEESCDALCDEWFQEQGGQTLTRKEKGTDRPSDEIGYRDNA